MIARKRFGQHFLTQPEICKRIVRAANVQPGDRVLEIGPGRGILTDALVNAGALVTAVEVDRDLAAALRESRPTLKLVEGDASQMDLVALVGPGARLVANMPYNVGTGLTMDALDSPFASITVMLQREVVDRLLALPGSEAYGAMSVRVAARAIGRFEFGVAPGAFTPPPKVDSAVVTLIRRTDHTLVEGFDRVVKAAFAQRRKTILNSLSSLFDRERAASALGVAGIGTTVRAETLDLAAFERLATAFLDG